MKTGKLTLAAIMMVAATGALAQGGGGPKASPGQPAPAAAHCAPNQVERDGKCVAQGGNNGQGALNQPARAQAAPAPKPQPADHVYNKGERIPDGYSAVNDPARYGLDPHQRYYRVGDRFYQVNETTREVLAFVGALSDLLD
ncbi:hypothetical protein [Pseudoruegeria sp. HB172150]|uniref:hypothetical protein n=1 Tax=Pseudoruegeria sp. HB172150 TaxID=2721164 RepID=UPI001557200A|nr:hypothetical protein [Pseudoruegeria sp. HB172150]